MPDGYYLELHQIGQARGDLYAINEELAVIRMQLARLPTRNELARLALLAILTGAVLVLARIEALFR